MSDPFACPTCPPGTPSEPVTLPKVHGGTMPGRKCSGCGETVPVPRLKGFRCPNCHGVRLCVFRCREVSPGVLIRRRTCTACGHRVKTREVQVAVLPSGIMRYYADRGKPAVPSSPPPVAG